MADTTGGADAPKTERQPEQRAAPTRKLPSDRMAYAKQLDLLRAYAALSGSGDAVKLADAAGVIKIHPSNLSTANPFFMENGLLEKKDGGYVPTNPVIEYGKSYAWNAQTAGQKLGVALSVSWFGSLLKKRVAFGPLPEEQAIEILAVECSASPEFKSQIRMLIDYAETAGVIRRDNNNLVAVDLQPEPPTSKSPPADAPTPEPPPDAGRKQPPAANHFFGADGAVSLNINIQVDLAELKGWPADRIAAFFTGIAAVVAAREKK